MSSAHDHGDTGTAATPSNGAGTDRDLTPIGVDVGVNRLATAAPAGAAPDDALVVSGTGARAHYEHLATAVNALKNTKRGERAKAPVFVAFYHRIAAELTSTAARVVRYAQEFPAPVLAVEDVPHGHRPLWEVVHGGVEFGTWLLPAIVQAITERAVDAGIPVARVDRDYTTKECHQCGQWARQEGATIVCTTPDCPVDEVCRDRSAALSIAARLDDV